MTLKQKVSAVATDDGVAADIMGFDFSDFDATDIADLRKCWLQYGVLRFRETNITDQQHVTFSRHFGELVIHSRQLQESGDRTFPEILVLGNVTKDGKNTGAAGANWHTDMWFDERPPAGAMSRHIELPTTGGDTYWLSMYHAYETLPEALRRTITGRQIFFQSVYEESGKLRTGKVTPKSEDYREWDGIVHPLVRTHPESDRKALYLGGTSDKAWIVGLPLDESNDLLGQLWTHMASTDRVFVHKWREGDIIMWDNRCTMHRRDSYEPQATRIMHRTTMIGERPV